MAKLEIFNSKLKVAGGATPRTSTLVLPMSLASNVRSGVQAITKSIADIQKDLYKIEDENQINEVRPVLDVELTKKYTKYKNSTDITNGPTEFEQDIKEKNFEILWKDKSLPVQKALKKYLSERKIE